MRILGRFATEGEALKFIEGREVMDASIQYDGHAEKPYSVVTFMGIFEGFVKSQKDK
jgi:hypothetical protein